MHSAIAVIRESQRPKPASHPWIRVLKIAGASVTLLTVGVFVDLALLVCFPLRFISASAVHHVSGYATHFAWSFCQYMFEDQDNSFLTVSGLESIVEGESAYVISNHVFFGDFYMIHALARRRNMMSSCRYFLKDSIKYIPIFGWGMYCCNFPFLKRNWQRDSNNIRQSLDALISNRLKVWLVSFLEGHRFDARKYEESQVYAKNSNLPMLQHLLLPRPKGFIATIHALRQSHVKYVYNVTLGYYHSQRGFGNCPSLWDILLGRLDEFRFHAHIDKLPIVEIPASEEGATRWLYDTWSEKDKLLVQMKAAFESSKESSSKKST